MRSALLGVIIATVVYCAPEITLMVQNKIFITRLSPALEHGILASELNPVLVTYYIVALSLKYIALLVTGAFLVTALIPMMRGRMFTAATARSLRFAGWGAIAWIIFRLGAEGLANNMAAYQLGIEWWWNAGAGTPLSDIAPAVLLATTLGVVATIVKRGAKLEEEVEGLV
ncbi:hypothetical protein [Corynebacterium capitovis]|uniref:hypothetical protein n=1 Tax=Corynebacterium capitovis TaxID=131081 RepID=UPI00037DDADF|nr:hypothetical protein [Corynebacterium capitovis]